MEAPWALNASQFLLKCNHALIRLEAFSDLLGKITSEDHIDVSPLPEDAFEGERAAQLRAEHVRARLLSAESDWPALSLDLVLSAKDGLELQIRFSFFQPTSGFFADAAIRLVDSNGNLLQQKVQLDNRVAPLEDEWDGCPVPLVYTYKLNKPLDANECLIELKIYTLSGIDIKTSMPRARNEASGNLLPGRKQAYSDFDACWADTVCITFDSESFQVQKALAEARIPYIDKLLHSEMSKDLECMQISIPEVSSSSFKQLLSLVLGGSDCFEHLKSKVWHEEGQLEQVVEVLRAADFLGCDVWVGALQDYLVMRLRSTENSSIPLAILQKVETGGFPLLPRLADACFYAVSLQVLAVLCRCCTTSYLVQLLRTQTLTSFHSLKELVAMHTAGLMPLLRLNGLNPSVSSPDQSSLELTSSSLIRAAEAAEQAQLEKLQLEEEITVLRLQASLKERPLAFFLERVANAVESNSYPLRGIVATGVIMSLSLPLAVIAAYRFGCHRKS